jgi:acyl dehydratase
MMDMKLADLAGHDLGTRVVSYEDRDAILYALAVGAAPDQLDLVYERDLRVLPTYACALGLWALVDAGALGAYDRMRSLQAGQGLEMHGPLPRCGSIETMARITGAWDKGKAAMVDIEVSSEVFTATYAIFLPGMGGWGGERGPSPAAEPEPGGEPWRAEFATRADQAVLYRLTGDPHPIHIDPEVARANGFDRPILHGLCTLGIAARELAAAAAAHPADLQSITARLAAPVMPGDIIEITATGSGNGIAFEAGADGNVALKGGRAVFGGAA